MQPVRLSVPSYLFRRERHQRDPVANRHSKRDAHPGSQQYVVKPFVVRTTSTQSADNAIIDPCDQLVGTTLPRGTAQRRYETDVNQNNTRNNNNKRYDKQSRGT